jgi:hypothetical protein
MDLAYSLFDLLLMYQYYSLLLLYFYHQASLGFNTELPVYRFLWQPTGDNESRIASGVFPEWHVDQCQFDQAFVESRIDEQFHHQLDRQLWTPQWMTCATGVEGEAEEHDWIARCSHPLLDIIHYSLLMSLLFCVFVLLSSITVLEATTMAVNRSWFIFWLHIVALVPVPVVTLELLWFIVLTRQLIGRFLPTNKLIALVVGILGVPLLELLLPDNRILVQGTALVTLSLCALVNHWLYDMDERARVACI